MRIHFRKIWTSFISREKLAAGFHVYESFSAPLNNLKLPVDIYLVAMKSEQCKQTHYFPTKQLSFSYGV